LKKLTVDIPDEIYDIFKEMSVKLNLPIEKIFENYFCLDCKIPEFRISKKDYMFIIIVKNIIREIIKVKSLLRKNTIADKELQYKTIICLLSSAEAMIDVIFDAIDDGCQTEQNTSDRKATERYLHILDQIHELCLSKKGNMIKFLNLLVEEFDEIKMIRVE